MLGPQSAQASLGGNALSVEADRAVLGGHVNTAGWPDHTQFEITAASGIVVREFADRSGGIFAVSWSGPVPPDLRQLLGAHFRAYADALSRLRRPGLRRNLRIRTPGLVVECGGHLRAYFGRAFLPARCPAGFTFARLP